MSLIINDLKRSDEQQYVCQATNVVSTATSTVSLSVLGMCLYSFASDSLQYSYTFNGYRKSSIYAL